jgi:hypothetical protein
MHQIGHKMSEKNDFFRIMHILDRTVNIRNISMLDVVVGPALPVQLAFFYLITIFDPLKFGIVLLIQNLLTFFNNLNFRLFRNLQLKRAFLAIRKKTVKFADSHELIGNFNIFDKSP